MISLKVSPLLYRFRFLQFASFQAKDLKRHTIVLVQNTVWMIGYILYYIGSEFGSVHVIYIKTQANTLKLVIFFLLTQLIQVG